MKNKKKIKHIITTHHQKSELVIGEIPPPPSYRNLIRHTVRTVLRQENADMPCAVNIIITDDDGIRKYNSGHRGIDKATDVLSFPLQTYTVEGWGGMENPDIDLDTQTLPLGDIVISTQTIKRNARKYKYTFEKETVRMIIHSVLHLLGYDHSRTMEQIELHLLQEMGFADEYK